jgi:hypothetical protein
MKFRGQKMAAAIVNKSQRFFESMAQEPKLGISRSQRTDWEPNKAGVLKTNINLWDVCSFGKAASTSYQRAATKYTGTFSWLFCVA